MPVNALRAFPHPNQPEASSFSGKNCLRFESATVVFHIQLQLFWLDFEPHVHVGRRGMVHRIRDRLLSNSEDVMSYLFRHS